MLVLLIGKKNGETKDFKIDAVAVKREEKAFSKN
jgi:hypothetical protein